MLRRANKEGEERERKAKSQAEGVGELPKPMANTPAPVQVPTGTPVPIRKRGTINMGSNKCSRYIELKESISLNGYRGLYFVCGTEAYFSLPEGWYGSCYLTYV